MTSFQKRLVLKPEVSSSDFELVAWDQNWNLADMGREDAGASIDTWITDDAKTEMHFVDDRPTGLSYITLQGEATALVEEQIRDNLAVWTLSEALEALRHANDSKDKAKCLLTVALIAPEHQDDAVADRLRPLAKDPEPYLRQSFIEATGFLPWLSLVEIVEDLTRNDPDQAVRENAQLLLDGLAATGEDPRRSEP